ncbi:MAG: hypothetical protein OHK0024_16010 [Thalassobaculales bacterium]
MAMSIAFDTYRYAQRLKAAGFTEEQAAAQVETLSEIVAENLATKRDIEEIRREIEQVRHQIATLDADLRKEIAALDTNLRKEIAVVDAGLRAHIADIHAQISRQMHATAMGMVGCMVAIAGIVLAIQKLL